MVGAITDLSNVISSSEPGLLTPSGSSVYSEALTLLLKWHNQYPQPVFCKDSKAASDNIVTECLYNYSCKYTPSDSFSFFTEKVDWKAGRRQVLNIKGF